MKTGPFGAFRVVFSALRAWGKVPEGPKIAQKGRFVLVFSRFFASFRSFLSTPNFQKSTPQKNLALTFESEKAPNFADFSLTDYCSVV